MIDLCGPRLQHAPSTAFAAACVRGRLLRADGAFGCSYDQAVHCKCSLSCRVMDPKEADLFFIPLRHVDVCQWYENALAPFEECGLVHGPHNITGMWQWLMQQPSFSESDGSDHFLFMEYQLSSVWIHNVRSKLLCAAMHNTCNSIVKWIAIRWCACDCPCKSRWACTTRVSCTRWQARTLEVVGADCDVITWDPVCFGDSMTAVWLAVRRHCVAKRGPDGLEAG